MLKITILTMFPQFFESFLASPIPRRAVKKKAARIRILDIKTFAGGCYRHIDDGTYGGGSGMILRALPVIQAIEEACAEEDGEMSPGGIIKAALTPSGHLYTQESAKRYARAGHLILICGHYEGMDERIYDYVDERISIGDFIVSGGEIASLVVADSVLRLLPDVLKEGVTSEESFGAAGLLEYPQYTRPVIVNGKSVPEVLLTGDHEKIRRYRLKESLRTTLQLRPDLLAKREFSKEEEVLLGEIQMEEQQEEVRQKKGEMGE